VEPTDISPRADAASVASSREEPTARLRLYIARSTPNSVRAKHNLSVALDGFQDGLVPPEIEIIDVFLQPRRAITDGVIVTPTLIGSNSNKRFVLMGDLADQVQLQRVIRDLLALS
jgi:circadian clock protein KaiB